MDQHEGHLAWLAVGSPVVELTYHGGGAYSAHATTITRATASQVVTATGRRFWRDRLAHRRVGETTLRIAGISVDYNRLVRPDNPHAVKALAAATNERTNP